MTAETFRGDLAERSLTAERSRHELERKTPSAELPMSRLMCAVIVRAAGRYEFMFDT